MTPLPGAEAALAPVRDAMLREARGQAAAMLAQARQDAAALLAGARRDAAAAVAQAREAGQVQAAALAAAQLSHARRDARARLLRAQRDAYDELGRRVQAAVAKLPAEPGYPRLVARLTRAALAAAGPGATTGPHPDGGVVATAQGVVVDCSLPALAGQAVEALGPELASLWGAAARGQRDTGQ